MQVLGKRQGRHGRGTGSGGGSTQWIKCCLLVGLLALLATPAQARGPESSARPWSVPAGCPGRDVFEAHLLGWLSENSTLLDYSLHVQVRAIAGGTSYALELDVAGRDRRLQRQLSDHSCATVVEAAALVAAIFIEPGVLGGAPPPQHSQPAQAAPPEPRTAPPPPAEERARPANHDDESSTAAPPQEVNAVEPPLEPETTSNKPQRRTSGSRRRAISRRLSQKEEDTAPLHVWSTEMSTQAASGVFAPTAAHLGLGLRWRVRAFGLRLRLTVEGPSSIQDPRTPTRRIVGVASSAELDTCLLPGGVRVRVPVCASVALAPAWARGTGVANAQTRGQLTWGAALETGLEIDVSPRLYLGVSTRVGLIPRGASFTLEDESLALKSRWWSLRGGFYVGMRWSRGRRGG